mmetsp:Transcript_4873/g.10756  ORF Transcript_4873/g.10756 Transcript_4873/m.10756 type:complete len:210 (-) Transcript_4873:199-828(-)
MPLLLILLQRFNDLRQESSSLSCRGCSRVNEFMTLRLEPPNLELPDRYPHNCGHCINQKAASKTEATSSGALHKEAPHQGAHGKSQLKKETVEQRLHACLGPWRCQLLGICHCGAPHASKSQAMDWLNDQDQPRAAGWKDSIENASQGEGQLGENEQLHNPILPSLHESIRKLEERNFTQTHDGSSNSKQDSRRAHEVLQQENVQVVLH